MTTPSGESLRMREKIPQSLLMPVDASSGVTIFFTNSLILLHIKDFPLPPVICPSITEGVFDTSHAVSAEGDNSTVESRLTDRGLPSRMTSDRSVAWVHRQEAQQKQDISGQVRGG